jgi:hypothetical protein
MSIVFARRIRSRATRVPAMCEVTELSPTAHRSDQPLWPTRAAVAAIVSGVDRWLARRPGQSLFGSE